MDSARRAVQNEAQKANASAKNIAISSHTGAAHDKMTASDKALLQYSLNQLDSKHHINSSDISEQLLKGDSNQT